MVKKAKIKEERSNVVDTHEGRIVSPNESILIKAINNKTWVVGNKDKISGSDYAMFDLVLTGASGFKPFAGMTHLDVLRHFYDKLYPFIEHLIAQYLFLIEECECQADELQILLKRAAKRTEEIKIMEKYLENIGKLKEYEEFKQKFLVDHAPSPKEI